MLIKIFIDVIILHDKEGNTKPLAVFWKDKKYEIDKIKDISKRSFKTGGAGLQYLCFINGKDKYIFYDTILNKWFIEGTEKDLY
jgi:hypothetical protein